jgi:hypothetical protein
MEMLGRVTILRIVAATDVSAGPAEAQMDPSIAQLEALLATATTWTVGPEPTVHILTSRMSSTTTHTPTGKLAAP